MSKTDQIPKKVTSSLFSNLRIKRLIKPWVEMYNQTYALDYCSNLADFVASRIHRFSRRQPHSYRFGNRRDCSDLQAG
jgi:hypothetical protein